MPTLATLTIEVDTDTSRALSGMKSLGSSVGSGLGGMAKTIGVGVAKGAAIAGAGLAAMGALAVKGALEAEKVAAQTGAVLESTGGAANVTAGDVASLATEIQNYSGMSDEAVASGENLLLTFTNIRNEAGAGNDIFNQATKIMADMSTALGQDMSSSAVQLGKALNDPIRGVTALQRVGVSFTEAQREQIAAMVESGDTMGAQQLILAELTKEFGGSAKAIGETAGGQFNILKETVGNALEEVGGSILEVAQTVLPVLSGAFVEIVNAVGPALNQLFQALAPVISQLVEALAPVIGEIAAAFAELVIALLPLIPPLGDLLVALAPLIPLLVTLLVDILEPLIPALAAVIEKVADVVEAFVTWVKESGVLKTIGDIVSGVVELVITVVGGLIGFIGDAWGLIRDITVTVWDAIKGAVTGVWDAIKAAAQTIWGVIKDVIIEPVRAVKDVVLDVFRSIKETLGTIWRGIKDVATTVWNGVADAVKTALNIAIDAINLFIRSMNRVSGALDFLGGPFLNWGDIPQIPNLAHGGLITRAGLAVVGERGPELLGLPAGAQVLPMPRVTGGMPGGGGAVSVINNGTMIGLSPDDLARLLRDEIIRLRRRNGTSGIEGVA